MAAQRKVIVLVGHHGPKTGTWWNDAGGLLDEWELAARIATTILYRLHGLGWIAIPGSAGRPNPEGLHSKRAYVNACRPDLCIEVHFNEASKPGARRGRWPGVHAAPFELGCIPIEGVRGVSVLHNRDNPDTFDLARRVSAAVSGATGLPLAYGSGLDPRPVQSGEEGYIYLIARTVCPTVLLEVAFLSNPEDRALMRSDWAIFDKVGRATGDAVQEWWHMRRQEDDL
ncbi:MAG: N-acetylmuramoyl-L-alanine amidase [Methanophagales archaeon]|nr:N-acetylmuramoyl-L-alanine amidase [Methanophagales archaeon]